jgi:DNA-binding winged helix-turn-helix (wHTH) protein
MQYVFDDARLDTQRYELRRTGVLVKLEPKVFEILVYLLGQRHRVVTRQELLEHVWSGQFLSDASLTARIMVARQAIGDSGRTQRLIQTIHGRGYRFVAPVDEVDEGAVVRPPPPLSVASATPAMLRLAAGSPAAPPAEPLPTPLVPESHATRPLDYTAQVEEYKLVTVLVGRLTGTQSLEPEALHRLHQAFSRLILRKCGSTGAPCSSPWAMTWWRCLVPQ